MARLSVGGERSILALIAEQYAEIVDLREALAAARSDLAHARQITDAPAGPTADAPPS